MATNESRLDHAAFERWLAEHHPYQCNTPSDRGLAVIEEWLASIGWGDVAAAEERYAELEAAAGTLALGDWRDLKLIAAVAQAWEELPEPVKGNDEPRPGKPWRGPLLGLGSPDGGK